MLQECGVSFCMFLHHTHPTTTQSGAVVQDNYVERLELAVVLNVPAWFSIAWKIACSLMDERTTARFRICGNLQVDFCNVPCAHMPPIMSL